MSFNYLRSFPCSDSPANYSAPVGLINAYLGGIFSSFPGCHHLIAGDFNFQCFPGDFRYDSFVSLCDMNLNHNAVTGFLVVMIYLLIHMQHYVTNLGLITFCY